MNERVLVVAWMDFHNYYPIHTTMISALTTVEVIVIMSTYLYDGSSSLGF